VRVRAVRRRLPDGRRYGVVGGTGRLVESIGRFRFGPRSWSRWPTWSTPTTLDWLAATGSPAT
jgi:nicotinate phosphoribosyltransferase